MINLRESTYQVHQLLENVFEDEVAPGLHSLEDIDVEDHLLEIRKASAFIETLDMEKVGMYLTYSQGRFRDASSRSD